MAPSEPKDWIDAGARLVLDTSAILAYLEGTEPVSSAATTIFDSLIASGRNPASISTVSVTEVLVRPMRAVSASAVGTVEAFLTTFPNVDVVPVSYQIAREAARIRAATALRTPDAMILATAVALGSPIVISNDARWRPAIDRASLALTLGLLADLR